MNKKIENLKRQYEEIPVPEELKGRIEEAIRQGKEDAKMDTKMKRNSWQLVCRKGGLVAAAAMLSIVVLSNSSAKTAQALENIPVIGAISRVVTFRTFEDKRGDYEAKIETPRVESEAEEKKHLIQGKDGLNQTMEAYTEQIKKAYEEDMEAFGELGKEAVNTSYQVLADNERLLSIRIDTTIAVGSSDSYTKIYHLDKITGNQMALKDFFKADSEYLQVISDALLEQMRKANAEGEDYLVDSETAKEFDFTTLEPEQNCYWTEDGALVIVFDKYQVAAGYMGMPELTVERAVFEDCLKAEWR